MKAASRSLGDGEFSVTLLFRLPLQNLLQLGNLFGKKRG